MSATQIDRHRGHVFGCEICHLCGCLYDCLYQIEKLVGQIGGGTVQLQR